MIAPNQLTAKLWRLKYPDAVVTVGQYELTYTDEQNATIQSEINLLERDKSELSKP